MTAAELHTRITHRGLVEKWSRFVVEKWQKQIERHDAIHTRELAKSFIRSTAQEKITFRFLKYGVFVDMGAGSGYRKGARIAQSVSVKGRKPKVWKSRTLYAEVAKLAELIARENGRETANYLVSELKIPIVIES